MRDFGRLAQKLFNVPLMIEPAKAEMVCAAIMDQLGIAKFSRIDGVTLGAAELKQRADDGMSEDRPQTRFYQLLDGVATIPVDGTLVQKQSGLDPWSGMVGYNQVIRKVREARSDSAVRAILLLQDSPGGEVAKCFDTAKEIYEGSARFGGKPIWSFADEMSCSASYALSSVCDRVFMPETGIIGSVGVWTMLADFTKALDKDGVAVTLRRAGERKARGGPYEKWDAETLSKIDAWLDQTWGIFASVVSQGRPGMSVDDVFALEGDWFPGEDALPTGLIDGIGSEADVFDALRKQVARA
jgi:signal peptide peptidase SppA